MIKPSNRWTTKEYKKKKKKTKTKGESYTCTMRRSEVRGVEYNQKHAL